MTILLGYLSREKLQHEKRLKGGICWTPAKSKKAKISNSRKR